MACTITNYRSRRRFTRWLPLSSGPHRRFPIRC